MSHALAEADDTARTAVEQALMRQPGFSRYKLRVDVHSGVVYLRGAVTDLRFKKQAGSIAGKIAGARRIVNRLVVAPYTGRDDACIAQEVRDALARCACAASGVQVAVNRGVAVISGTVVSFSDKDALEYAVSSVPGVNFVVSHVSVPARSNAWLEAELRSCLTLCLGSQAQRIEIKVRQKRIFLSGCVSGEAERLLAEYLACSVPGVSEVVNRLAVALVA